MIFSTPSWLLFPPELCVEHTTASIFKLCSRLLVALDHFVVPMKIGGLAFRVQFLMECAYLSFLFLVVAPLPLIFPLYYVICSAGCCLFIGCIPSCNEHGDIEAKICSRNCDRKDSGKDFSGYSDAFYLQKFAMKDQSIRNSLLKWFVGL